MSTLRKPKCPPLQPGDRLTRDEFERRYFAMPGVKKAELIEGEVYMPAPVNHEFHGGPHTDALGWLIVYRASTPGTDTGDNSTVRIDVDNELQPDAILFVRPNHGGRVAIDADGYISGSPELVVEVSASTASIDLGKRMNVYRRNQVAEYVVWRVYDEAVDWFVFRAGEYVRLETDPADGLLKSVTFPGLWLDAAALVRRDLATVLAVLNRGLASPGHTAFARQLAARRVDS